MEIILEIIIIEYILMPLKLIREKCVKTVNSKPWKLSSIKRHNRDEEGNDKDFTTDSKHNALNEDSCLKSSHELPPLLSTSTARKNRKINKL